MVTKPAPSRTIGSQPVGRPGGQARVLRGDLCSYWQFLDMLRPMKSEFKRYLHQRLRPKLDSMKSERQQAHRTEEQEKEFRQFNTIEKAMSHLCKLCDEAPRRCSAF